MRMPDVPAALRWLVAAVLLAGVAWALVVPAWQVPDEDTHHAYVQTLAELHRRPADDGRPARLGGKSSEQGLAERESGFAASVQRPEIDPSWSEAAEARWRREQDALPGRHGATAAASNSSADQSAGLLPLRGGAVPPGALGRRARPALPDAAVVGAAAGALLGVRLAPGRRAPGPRSRRPAAGRRGVRARAHGDVRLLGGHAGRADLPAVGPRLLADGPGGAARRRSAGTPSRSWSSHCSRWR